MPSKKVVPEKSESQVRREAVAKIEELKSKGVANDDIMAMLARMFRARHLDAFMSPELLGKVRTMLQVLAKQKDIDDFYIDGLRAMLVLKEETNGHEV